MELAVGVAETLDSVPGAPQVNDGLAEPARRSCPPSPEEGHRLIRDFLRLERADLRQEIFRFVAEMLRVQDAGQRQAP